MAVSLFLDDPIRVFKLIIAKTTFKDGRIIEMFSRSLFFRLSTDYILSINHLEAIFVINFLCAPFTRRAETAQFSNLK
jgi:hypothetical protein